LKIENFRFNFKCFGAGDLQDFFVREMTGILGDKFHFGGVVAGKEKIRALKPKATFSFCRRVTAKKNGGYVCFSTVHMVMESHDNPEFAAKVNAADLIITDGMPLVWMQKLQGEKRRRACGRTI
jgi:hypothetical protein